MRPAACQGERAFRACQGERTSVPARREDLRDLRQGEREAPCLPGGGERWAATTAAKGRRAEGRTTTHLAAPPTEGGFPTCPPSDSPARMPGWQEQRRWTAAAPEREGNWTAFINLPLRLAACEGQVSAQQDGFTAFLPAIGAEGVTAATQSGAQPRGKDCKPREWARKWKAWKARRGEGELAWGDEEEGQYKEKPRECKPTKSTFYPKGTRPTLTCPLVVRCSLLNHTKPSFPHIDVGVWLHMVDSNASWERNATFAPSVLGGWICVTARALRSEIEMKNDLRRFGARWLGPVLGPFLLDGIETWTREAPSKETAVWMD
eukprot:CAMPEP_0113687660 /NCGR_PEP_ID=MMETSP0038_2-20120614/16069_1 /TAXON_ID=2898 /ORGANISM="Cryptomonas paramecium" /LENGTH=319 /DNA_ID=CAMNT_0000608319 /DNA_START=106 /DNA_END=1064 /DNA_ORIENTATION=+ /assembly_acc=CAM_ASM_000170